MFARLCVVFVSLIFFLGCVGCNAVQGARVRLVDHSTPRVVLGVERIYEAELVPIFQGKSLGLFTNQTGVDSELRSSVDRLRNRYNLAAIYVPEHGLFGAVKAGEKFGSSEYQGIPVFSLYGDSRRPSKEMLEGIDAMVVDIQDVGVRHYTYFSSLAYIMEECAQAKKEVIVLDRPNPLGGVVQGPVLKKEYATFIGLYPIPLRHGLTIGEFACYINAEQGIGAQLNVVPMKGYRNHMDWQATRLPWVQTSPRIPYDETAYMYDITGCIGNTSLSVGIGTGKPFHFVGAEFIDAARVKEALDKAQIKGLAFRATGFSPESGALAGKLLQGVEIYVMNKKQVNLPEAQFKILQTLRELYPDRITFDKRKYGSGGYTIDIGWGEPSLREETSGMTAEQQYQLFTRWREECRDFERIVKPYKLYE